MDSVKIFHIADVHLDTPFSGMSPTEAASCKNGLRGAFAKAILSAKNRGVQIFLIAGDLFDGAFVSPDTEEFLIEKFSSYPDCHFFISPGNHDPFTASSFYAKGKLPKNVHVFREKSRVELEELGADVYGMGFTSREYTESPLTAYPSLREDRINILVCHGDLGVANSVYGPISKDDIGLLPFDYIALGHIHKATDIITHKGVSIAYSGCIEGRGFDETGEKGGIYGTVSKGRTDLSFFPLSVRRYETEEVDISGFESRLQVTDAVKAVMKRHGGARLRVVLTGRPKDAFYISSDLFSVGGSDPDYIEIKDKSVPALSVTAIEQEKTLRGAFYRRMMGRIESAADEKERMECVYALKLGLAALEGRDTEA
ncbi:MAG: metallophosphoesterase [Clostridia bacterium]|nr:metallophosphoesterase [Clostridia bacterium]